MRSLECRIKVQVEAFSRPFVNNHALFLSNCCGISDCTLCDPWMLAHIVIKSLGQMEISVHLGYGQRHYQVVEIVADFESKITNEMIWRERIMDMK